MLTADLTAMNLMMRSESFDCVDDVRWRKQDQNVVFRHEAALELIQREPILDVGGGDGLLVTLLRQRGRRAVMIDGSSVAIRKAREKGASACLGNITKPLPFANGCFGTACALDVLEHLHDPLFTLKEMARVAESVVIVVPNFHYWKDRLLVAYGKLPRQCKPHRNHVYWFNHGILLRLVREAGLRIDAHQWSGFKRLAGLGPALASLHPNLFAHSLAVRLRRADQS